MIHYTAYILRTSNPVLCHRITIHYINLHDTCLYLCGKAYATLQNLIRHINYNLEFICLDPNNNTNWPLSKINIRHHSRGARCISIFEYILCRRSH